MMISPEGFAEELSNRSYKELLVERDSLIEEIRRFEKSVDDCTGKGSLYHPSPEVKYQMNLEYLAQVCLLISQKYNEEYVWDEVDGKDGNNEE